MLVPLEAYRSKTWKPLPQLVLPPPLYRDQLPFPCQLTIWSWRLMGQACPDIGLVAARVSRAYTIIGAPAAFPAIYALVSLGTNTTDSVAMPACPSSPLVAPTERFLLSAIRHLQRGSETLGRQALNRLVDDSHRELFLHYVRLYACELAVVGHALATTRVAGWDQP